VQRERLLGVHQARVVEVAEAPAPSRSPDQVAEGRQHPELDVCRILCGELELGERVLLPGADGEGVEQDVGLGPGPLRGLAVHADDVVVEGHALGLSLGPDL